MILYSYAFGLCGPKGGLSLMALKMAFEDGLLLEDCQFPHFQWQHCRAMSSLFGSLLRCHWHWCSLRCAARLPRPRTRPRALLGKAKGPAVETWEGNINTLSNTNTTLEARMSGCQKCAWKIIFTKRCNSFCKHPFLISRAFYTINKVFLWDCWSK